MKTVHHHLFSLRTLTGYALFGLLGLASPSLSAQTFTGRKFLVETPASFRAIIHPGDRDEAITIHLENYSAGAVRIQVLNQAQQPVYDDYVTRPGYLARLDVSALPAGTYTVSLRSRTARQTQQFLINRSASRHVVIAAPPTKTDSLFANKFLLISTLR
jgi:hypothetical protein